MTKGINDARGEDVQIEAINHIYDRPNKQKQKPEPINKSNKQNQQ